MGYKTFRDIEIGDTLDDNMEIEIEIDNRGEIARSYINREDAYNIVMHLSEVFDMNNLK